MTRLRRACADEFRGPLGVLRRLRPSTVELIISAGRTVRPVDIEDIAVAIAELAAGQRAGLLISRKTAYSVDFDAQQAIPDYDVLKAVAFLIEQPSGWAASEYASQTYLSHVPLRMFVQRPVALNWLRSFE